MITISKELFIETIKALEQQEKHDQECVKAFKVLLPNDYTTRYKNDWVIDQLIKNLQQAG